MALSRRDVIGGGGLRPELLERTMLALADVREPQAVVAAVALLLERETGCRCAPLLPDDPRVRDRYGRNALAGRRARRRRESWSRCSSMARFARYSRSPARRVLRGGHAQLAADGRPGVARAFERLGLRPIAPARRGGRGARRGRAHRSGLHRTASRWPTRSAAWPGASSMPSGACSTAAPATNCARSARPDFPAAAPRWSRGSRSNATLEAAFAATATAARVRARRAAPARSRRRRTQRTLAVMRAAPFEKGDQRLARRARDPGGAGHSKRGTLRAIRARQPRAGREQRLQRRPDGDVRPRLQGPADRDRRLRRTDARGRPRGRISAAPRTRSWRSRGG
jgi:hypothetical protein